MLNGRKIIVVMPAYNAELTLEKTYNEIPKDVVDEILLVDDKSHDKTVQKARGMGITTYLHEDNRGYGANQKTCYKEALNRGADIVIMLHPTALKFVLQKLNLGKFRIFSKNGKKIRA